MDKIDVLFRAKKNLLDDLTQNMFFKEDIEQLNDVDTESEYFSATKFICLINEDWIIEIEECIPFIEKAIAEERQFIRVDGETIPIEKVKKVSHESVKHLAKHSEMLTHVPKDSKDDIVPDKLYITEKETDYAVYENRFLYMLLDYMEKFISLRLNDIEKTHAKYIGKLQLNKKVENENRVFSIAINMEDIVKNNPFSAADKKCIQTVKRIQDCLQVVDSFLRTPLMTEVAKTPMIRLPITKTNVLKMNNNFKHAVALFEYLSSYEGLGYEVQEVTKEFQPINEELKSELSSMIRLLQFSSYEYGNDITELLLNNYKAEELRRKQETAKKLQERIEKMRKAARESDKTMEEYMLLLEERNQQLLKDSEELIRANNEILLLNEKIEGLNHNIENLNDKINELNDIIEAKNQEIAALNQKYMDEISALKKEHENQIASINEAHLNEIDELNVQFQDQINDCVAEYEEKIEAIHAETENKIQTAIAATIKELEDCKVAYKTLQESHSSLERAHQESVSSYESKQRDLENTYNALKRELEEENQRMKQEYLLYKGELDAIRYKAGALTPSNDFTSRDRFLELEEEMKSFYDFFEKQWKLTKKQIRKDILGKKK